MSTIQTDACGKSYKVSMAAAFSDLMSEPTMHKKCRKNVKSLRHSVDVKFQESR